MKIALLLASRINSYENLEILIKQNKKYDIHIFASINDDYNTNKIFYDIFKDKFRNYIKKIVIDKYQLPLNFKTTNRHNLQLGDVYIKTLSYFYNDNIAFNMAVDYSIENNFQYDLCLRFRSDIIVSDFPDLSEYDPKILYCVKPVNFFTLAITDNPNGEYKNNREHNYGNVKHHGKFVTSDIAYGNIKLMNIYCNCYNYIIEQHFINNENYFICFEYNLTTYLEDSCVNYKFFDYDYKYASDRFIKQNDYITICLNSQSHNFELNNLKYNMCKNVISYKYKHCIPFLDIFAYSCDNNINYNDEEYYYIFDCNGGDAFAHWIFESFIFYIYFITISKIYPNIKILTTNKKKYVKNILNFFRINNEVCYDICYNNVCFFPPIISLNDNKINESLFNELINQYSYYIQNNIKPTINNIDNIKNIIMLPRNTIDNTTCNDRIVPNLENIIDNIRKIGGEILNTYEINDIEKQFSIINSKNIIILDYGSSFFVNCIYLKNKKIIVLDNFYHSYQINTYISMKILYETIQHNNNVIIITPMHNNIIFFEDIYKHL